MSACPAENCPIGETPVIPCSKQPAFDMSMNS
jgi:hypothetical protein